MAEKEDILNTDTSTQNGGQHEERLASQSAAFTIHGYGLMIGLGFVAAYFMTEYRASKQGLDSDKIISLAGWTIIAGLICAKAFVLCYNF